MDFESGRATVPTRCGEVSYVAHGEGPAAVFVHGVGTNALLWRNVIGHLGATRRCIALDLPMHGHTPAPADPRLGLRGLAEVVVSACDALGLDRFDLVANDTGGAVAQVVAARQPERLRSLVLTNCETRDNLPPKAFKPTIWAARLGLLTWFGPRSLRDPERGRRAVFGSGYEDVTRLPLDVAKSFMEPVVGTRPRARNFSRLLTSLRASDLLAVEADLASVEVPTLVVWGTGDRFFDVRWAYWLRDHVPGVTRVVELHGARLFFPDERADELVPLLAEHWSTVDAAGAGR